MLTRRKRIVLTGVVPIGLVAIAVWIFILGPALIIPYIQGRNCSTVEWFCRLGVSPNRDAWLTGGVFHSAVASGDSNIVVMMIGRGANLNRIDGYGATPLHVATRHGDLIMMSLLVERGANVFLRDREGATALDLAAHEELVAPRRYLEELALKTEMTKP